MRDRVKFFIIALMNRLELPEYTLTEVVRMFQVWFRLMVELDYVEKYAKLCASCLLLCVLKEYGGDDWRRMREIVMKIRKHRAATHLGSNSNPLSVVYEILFFRENDDDSELHYIGETNDGHHRTNTGHLPITERAKKGKPVASSWYNVAVNNFEKDVLIAKIAETQGVRNKCGRIIDFIVRRTVETATGGPFNTFKQLVSEPVVVDGRGTTKSYELLQDCLRDIHHLLPLAEFRPVPIPSNTVFPIDPFACRPP